MAEEGLEPTDKIREDNEMSLKMILLMTIRWWRYILTKWIIFLIIGIFGGLLGLLYVYFKKPTYQAETTFVLEDEKGGNGMLTQLGGLANLAGIDAGGGGGGLFQGENIIQLYRSRSMIQKTLLSEVEYDGSRRLLIDHYIEFNGLKEQWLNDDKLKNIEFSFKNDQKLSRLHDSIMATIVQSIKKDYLTVIKPDKKLNIIKVEVKSKNELFAKAFNDQIVKNVNDFYVQTKTKKASQNLEILQNQTDSVRSVLSGAIYATATFTDAIPNLNLTRQVLRAPVQKSQFSAEVNKVILSELVKNLELAKLSLRKETPLIQVIDAPILPLANDKIGKLKGAIGGTACLIIILLIFFSLKFLFNNIQSE